MGIAGFWFLIFGVSFLRDRRLFKNGIFLVLSLMFAGLGVIFALESVNETAARWLVVAFSGWRCRRSAGSRSRRCARC